MSGERAFGFDNVCQEGRVIQKLFPNTKSRGSSDELVSQARRLNLETGNKIRSSDGSPVHRAVGYGIQQEWGNRQSFTVDEVT